MIVNADELACYERLILDKIQFRISKRVDLAFMNRASIFAYLDHVTDSLVFQLEFEMAGKNGTVSWPSDWWQAFKKRFFPAWLLKKYPIVYHEEQTVRVCPHINIPNNHEKHMEFIMFKGDFEDLFEDAGQT